MMDVHCVFKITSEQIRDINTFEVLILNLQIIAGTIFYVYIYIYIYILNIDQ